MRDILAMLEVLNGYAKSTRDGESCVGGHIQAAEELIRKLRWQVRSLDVAHSIIDKIDTYHEVLPQHDEAERLIGWIRDRLADNIPPREE